MNKAFIAGGVAAFALMAKLVYEKYFTKHETVAK